MKKQVAAFVICGLAVASVGFGVAPIAVFHGGDNPGVNAPFLLNGDLDTYGVSTYVGGFVWEDEGSEGHGEGGWTNNWGLIRYRPSTAGDPGTVVSMPADKDWVFEVSFKQMDAFGSEGPFYLKDEDTDLRMLGITNHQDGTYSLTASNPDNSMSPVATIDLPLGEWGDFVYHYKADSGTMDAYFNGTKVAEDFTTQDGALANWAQGEWQRVDGEGAATTTWFRNIKLGQFGEATEPQCNPGDADDDGDVDDDDLSLLLANWGGDVDCTLGEFSGVTPVDDDDLSLLLANWTGPLAAAVPEPTTMILIGLAAPALLKLRRKA